MNKSAPKKTFNDEIAEQLNHLDKKFKFRTHRPLLIQTWNAVRNDEKFSTGHLLTGLQIFTSAFVTDDSSPYEKDNFDQNIAYIIGRSLRDHSYIKETQATEGSPLEPGVIHQYFKNAEMLINKVDMIFPEQKKKDKLSTLCECFQAVAKNSHNSSFAFHGDTLKVSAPIKNQNPSIIIATQDPKEAVALLHGDKIRTLFAEFDETESAETIVKEFYGTDGKYAEHYRAFLDCRARYPDQKHLLE